MSVKFSSAPLCILAAAACVAGADAACNSTVNPGFEDGGGGSSSSGSTSGSSSGSSGSSSGFTSSNSSGSSSGSGSSGSSGGSGGTNGCAPTSATPATITIAANALVFSPANYLPMQAAMLGMGGYAFPYADTGSAACLNSNSFCAGGMAAATGYGAGIGVNLNQIPSAATPSPFTVPAGKMGVAYALTVMPPAKTFLIIDNNGTGYQAPVTAMSAMIPWSNFAIQTPDAGPATLTAAPVATHVQFQMSGATFNFCVTSLGFYP